MKKLIRTGALGATLAVALVVPAAALGADNSNCWGVVTSQRAVAIGDVGEHASSFAPGARLGLANVAKLVLGPDATLGDLGAALAEADGLSATHCP